MKVQKPVCFNCGRKLKVNADGSYACRRCGFWHEADKKDPTLKEGK